MESQGTDSKPKCLRTVPSIMPRSTRAASLIALSAVFVFGLPAGDAAARQSERPSPEAFAYTGPIDDTPASFSPAAPATSAAERLLALADKIDATRTDTQYSHRTRVRRREGLYHFDCSGMMNWMLARVAPKAHAALDRERPVAATYVRVIAKAPVGRGRKGWQRIDDIEGVTAGDVFAWKRPADWPRGGNTGHVGIVLAPPVRAPFIEDAYLVRILDSTRYAHQDDSRAEDGSTGFGTGTILFMADADGHPIGYGWYGALSGGWYRTQVVFGRLRG